MYDLPGTPAAPAAAPVSDSGFDAEAFTREAVGSLQQTAAAYVEMVAEAAQLAQGVWSTEAEQQLAQLRVDAIENAEGMTWMSRVLRDTAHLYPADGPVRMRPLMQDIAESLLLISRCAQAPELLDLPLLDVDEITGFFAAHGAWLAAHAPAAAQADMPAQLPAPAQPEPAAAAPVSPYPQAPAAENPYPSAGDSPYPSPAQDPYPQAPAQDPYPPATPSAATDMGVPASDRTRRRR